MEKLNIKSFVFLALALTVLNTTIMAQEKFKEIKITMTSDTINVSADSLWEIIGPGFDKVGVWVSSVDHAEGSGTSEFEGAVCSERVCDIALKGIDKVKEKITHYDAVKQELAYEVIEGSPGFVLSVVNRWSVTKITDSKSTFTMDITMRVKRFQGFLLGGIMKKQLVSAIETTFEDLRVYAETGELSETKKDRLNELEKKKNK